MQIFKADMPFILITAMLPRNLINTPLYGLSKSAERIAVEDGAAIIKSASNWQTLHRQLAEKGLRYEKKGSGAMLGV